MAGRGRFSSPGIKFKTAAVILAVVHRLLSYNTSRGFQLLWSDIFSWLLHLPVTIELDSSKSRRMLLLTGEAHFRRCYKPNLTFDTCWGIFKSVTATGAFSHKKWRIITFSHERVKNHNFFMLKSDKSLLFVTKSYKSLLFLVKGNKLFTVTDREHLLSATNFLLSALIKA